MKKTRQARRRRGSQFFAGRVYFSQPFDSRCVRTVRRNRKDGYLSGTNARQLFIPFRNNLSYFALDLDRVCRGSFACDLLRSLLLELMALFEQGSFENSLPHNIFPVEDAANALWVTWSRRKISGKVVAFPSAALKLKKSSRAARRPREPTLTYLIARRPWRLWLGSRALAGGEGSAGTSCF